jgi:RimJ/RimL family protein N-acetyltransferase
VSSLDSSMLKLVDAYWAEFFDCPPDALRTDTPRIVAHAGLGDYAGCYELAALASYQIWGAQIAHIFIVTHPAFRGQGYATAGVSSLTQTILERTLVPQYRTLEGNAASMAIAKRLGFLHYATSLAVRFALPKRNANSHGQSSY